MKVKNIRKYLTEEQITERVKAMGEQISKDYGGETVYLICILKGSIFFTCELAKRITSPVEIDFMSVSVMVPAQVPAVLSRSEKILILQLRERMSLWSRTSLIPEEH